MHIVNENGQEFIKFRDVLLICNKTLSPNMRQVIEEQTYEIIEIDIILKNISNDDIVLELGSAIGAVSCCVLTKFTPQKYICVEANKDLIYILKKNHKVNKIENCEVIHGVMINGDKPKELDFYVHDDFWASSLTPFKNPRSVQKVKTYNFQSIIDEHKPTFLICDIEGGEFDLFLDKQLDISSLQKICIEVHNTDPKRLVDLYAFFIDNGFYCKWNGFQVGVNFFERASRQLEK